MMKHQVTKKSHRLIAIILMMVFMPSLLPINYVFASNTGPNAPEVAGFEPVDATDMVNLGTGDLAYSLPLMDVDGFPVTMAYHAGITSTLDASWTGLGWYLNTGAINRQQVAVPDDWYAGKAINFISYENAETTYNLGVGFSAEAAEMGVGISWGGSKGLMGMVEASVGLNGLFGIKDNGGVGLSGSLNTNGGYYIGAYGSIGNNANGKVNASIGYSSGGDFNIGASGSNDFSSTGIGYSTSGTYSINAGAGGSVNGDSGVGGAGGGLSTGSFSSGDYDIATSSQGFKVSGVAVGIPVYIKFGRTKVKYSLRKGFLDVAYGSMYSSEAQTQIPFRSPDANFTDYQDRYTYMDVYEQPLPQEEAEFITDFRPNEEKLNFTYAGYDNFEVQANGINGKLKPRLFDNVTLFNRGFNAASWEDSNKKNHVFYHNGGVTAGREFGYNTNNQMQMYFEGAFSSKELIPSSTPSFVGSSLDDLVDDPITTVASFLNNPNNRATTPSFVEVFTNEELFEYGQSQNVVEPESLPFSQRNNTSLVDPKGIGAYKITSPDGKTYHFTLPVYHFETVKRTLLKTANQDPYDADDISESRQYNKYATHWLLTAVTGPDYVDVNSDSRVDPDDYGYWVRLDYGKWSDGYTWKQPYEDEARLYTTNQLSEIDEEDFGYFSFGRKQLYYLNKIVSREHSALFIKDIRHDAVGKSMDYRFRNENAGYNNNIGITGNPGPLNQSNANVHVKEFIAIPYRREYTLKLDRIVLVKNEVAQAIQNNLGSNLAPGLDGYQENESVNGTWQSPEFRQAYSNSYQYLLHQEDNVLDINDYVASNIESNVLKEVRFQHSYDLAKGSPNSIVTQANPFAGKLTLNRVQFRGKGGANYMPPYVFDYYDKEKENISLAGIRQEAINNFGAENASLYRQEYTKLRKQYIDNWGYIQGDEDRWSLKSIKMPTGAEINLTYGEDEYWTEAFSRRLWENDLEFNIENVSFLTATRAAVTLGIRNDNNSNVDDVIFTDYFQLNDTCSLDFYTSRCRNPALSGNNEVSIIDQIDSNAEVTAVSSGYLQLVYEAYIPEYETDLASRTSPQDPLSKTNEPLDDRLELSGVKEVRCAGGGTSTWNLIYRLLASRVPENEVGGGLRVSKIETVSSDGNIGVLEYDYNFPSGHEKQGRPSGITSFAPVDGLQFVPYQSELPAPGVQYEYVTLYRKDANDDILDYTRYNFHVLQPTYDIFDENITLENTEGTASPDKDPIFWSEVSKTSSGLNEAKEVQVHVNTAILGQFKKIEQFNQYGQLISKVGYDYTNGRPLDQIGKGRVQESFNSLKSIFETDTDGNSPVLKNRLLSVSTRTDYSNLLKKVTNHANGQSTSVEYGDVDPILGSFRESRTTRADGTIKRDYRIPAYEVYPDMGPKALNLNNKNMLTQEAMNITDVDVAGTYKSISASVTTWKNSSFYNDESTSTADGIWRKHESYVWKGALDANGTFGLLIDQNDFNWSSPQTNTQWQKISETTRYDHWSSPLEVKDVNNNFIATKRGDDNTKVIATGNARYSEIYYSGAEYVESVNKDYEGGVYGAAAQSSDVAHTGQYSSKIGDATVAFRVSGTVGTDHLDNSQTFRPGKYKVSVWAYQGGAGTELRNNGQSIAVSEMVQSGDWTQLNYYLDFAPGTSVSVEIVNLVATNAYYDDFRLHPIYTAMNTYVYNQWNELTHILGANNMATMYEYDSGGRLSNTYAEVEDFNGSGSGGLKKTKSFKYNYQEIGN